MWTDGWTDGYGEANCRLSSFCERAEKENINKKNNSQNLWVKNKAFKCESESSISN
jgi:hypothetical protein